MPYLEALQRFLTPLTSQVTETYEWPGARFAVTTYLHGLPPPIESITSVRAVVLREGAVLVVQDPDGYHIVPGGRREAGESLIDTVVREVLEETGWQVTVGPPLGFKHFRRLSSPAPGMAATPDFTQLVYLANATQHHPEAREQGGYELGAAFVALAQIAQIPLSKSDQLFIQAVMIMLT